ncbi:MAG: hypothetical protein CSA22_01090 [Deltaproteobacteria bacterium]|nr:MAG: hypothetical protein CSA22_01090 [Deltaproteobacteria bacterium]
MNRALRILYYMLMTAAMGFGFMHLFVPDTFPYAFERLHVFLFNLCTGGTIILLYSMGASSMNRTAGLFLSASLAFAVCAFFKWYAPAILLALLLSVIVESVRIRRFSLFPAGFFRKTESVADKFNQASLLCLSMGLLISAGVMVNNTYTRWIDPMPKLQLDTFFLGFSFPLSLITLSVMFRLVTREASGIARFLKVLGFWGVNLGVIIFFLFILFEKLVAQMVVTTLLFFCVIMIFYLFYQHVGRNQQRKFLSSGMSFLLFTAVTGIGYIVLEFFPGYYDRSGHVLLKLHSFASLYGWNLSGLIVISRFYDFPIRLHSIYLISWHWLTVAVLAPLGYYFTPFALVCLVSYMGFLYIVFFIKPRAGLYPLEISAEASN